MSWSDESHSITVGNHNFKPRLSCAAVLTGKYAKYYVRADMTATQQEWAKCSPFKIMMDASRSASKNSGQIIPFITNVQNNNDRMYNDMVSFIQTGSRKRKISEISYGIAARCVPTFLV